MNQNREQLARDRIDGQLIACGWTIQNKSSIYLHTDTSVAAQDDSTLSPAAYALFNNKKQVGIIEVKRAEETDNLIIHEE